MWTFTAQTKHRSRAAGWRGQAAVVPGGGQAGSANTADFPTLSMIPFYRCCDKRCQGLSNSAKGASLALWGGTGKALPSYGGGGSLLNMAARSRAALGPDTREHLGAVLRSKILQKSPRASSAPLSSNPLASTPAKQPQGQRKRSPKKERMSSSNRRGNSKQKFVGH